MTKMTPEGLRQRLNGGAFLAVPGLQDMVAAVIANKVGFEAVYGTGYWLTASALGLPDAGIASYTQMLDRMATLARAYLRQCQRVAKRLDIEIETITVTEARRRAKRLRQDRDDARGRAVGTRLNRTERGSADRRAWALAYQRATPHDDGWAWVDPPRTAAEVPHHSAIPRQPTGSRFEPISEARIGARPMPQVIPQRGPSFGDEGQGR